MTTLFSYVLFGLSLVLLIGNLYLLVLGYRSENNVSTIPYLGGIFCFLAILLHPDFSIRYYFWVPLLLDITIPMQGVGIVIYLLKNRQET